MLLSLIVQSRIVRNYMELAEILYICISYSVFYILLVLCCTYKFSILYV